MRLTELKIINYGNVDILKVAKYAIVSGTDRFNSFSMYGVTLFVSIKKTQGILVLVDT